MKNQKSVVFKEAKFHINHPLDVDYDSSLEKFYAKGVKPDIIDYERVFLVFLVVYILFYSSLSV